MRHGEIKNISHEKYTHADELGAPGSVTVLLRNLG